MIENTLRDTRFALRGLRRAPGFTVTAVLTMALGIGVNVAVFSTVDRLLFRPLPYGSPERLVLLRACPAGPERCNGSFPSLVAYEARSLPTLAGVAVAGPSSQYSLTPEPAGARPLTLSSVSPNLLRVLGVTPILGRDFREDDTGQPAALLSEESWRRRFGASEDVIGRTVWQGRSTATIVGIIPEKFIPPSWTAPNPAWDGLVVSGDDGWATIGTTGSVMAPVARLTDGITIEAARADVQRLAGALAPQLRTPGPGPGLSGDSIHVDPLQGLLFSRMAPTAWLVFGATGVLVLLACANLSTLLLAHGRSRVRESAVALALGSSRVRMLRVPLLESLLVCLMGSAFAVVLLAPASKLLLDVLPPLLARYAAGPADPRVLVTALIAAVVCALAGGVIPSLRAARLDLLTVLQRVSASGRRGRGHRGLLVAEAMLAVLLVVSALLMLRSFNRMATEGVGLEPDGLYQVTAMSSRRRMGTEAGLAYNGQILEAIAQMPDVSEAAAADSSGLVIAAVDGFEIGGLRVARYEVDSAFFGVLRMQLAAGRTFAREEVRQRAPVAVLNESLARALWPSEPPSAAIGRDIGISETASARIIGVVADIRMPGDAAGRPAAYVPLGEGTGLYGGEVLLRTRTGLPPDIVTLQARLRERLGDVNVAVGTVAPRFANALTDPRFRATLFSLLGLAALVLAATGVYAVSALDARQREYEIGVRMAFGATAGRVRRMIVGQTCRPALLGAAMGLAGAYASMSVVQRFLYRIDARDASTYVAVAAVMLATMLAATWVPARAVSRVDPVVALRSE